MTVNKLYVNRYYFDADGKKIIKGNLYIFVGTTGTTGTQHLSSALKYLNKNCRVVNVCEGEVWCRVVFIRENGSKHYTEIGKAFLVELIKETRKLKLNKIYEKGN